ncbi:sigma-54-dependent transcriptional regulator [Marinoscillum sp.]|uniref:sigma-54-dependent transcriptional regulator n=1 Tax=Marinoscillum sp. TaxID=2024838 RepID=UPI003BAC81F8
MNKGHILVVDDDPDVLHTARLVLKRHYEKVSTESSPVRLETLIKREDVDIVLLDMNFKTGATSGNEGLFWLKKIKELRPEIYVIMDTAYGDIQLAVESMKLGAVDFLVKPWEKEQLLSSVNTVYQLAKSNEKVKKLEGRESVLNQDINAEFGTLLTRSSSMEKVLSMIDKVASTDASVLILGENGTGKELIAREIHRRSNRSSEGLIKVDLGALPESLFESELFGHVKGSFTDAKEDRPGRFEIADGGSLFLDEIGNISTPMQSKMLSALQNRVITRVGSSRPVPFDVRLISATNQPLYEMVDQGKFRQDLLYRINTVEIDLPPLRERKEDILLLTNHFLELYRERYKKDGLRLEERAKKQLLNYPWPGNIRELQHAIERAVIMTEGGAIGAEDVLPSRKEKITPTQSLKVEDVERNAVIKAIERSGGNLSQAADELGIGRTTLYRKMKKYGI